VNALQENMEYYRSQHTTTGCKISHLIGIPLIALSIPTLFCSPRRAAQLFGVGWAFQFIGHYVFEKNKPVLFSEARDPLTLVSALVFCADGWARVLTGRPLSDPVYPQAGSYGRNGRNYSTVRSRRRRSQVPRIVSS